jgi:galactose mutarotase-like enzyme
VSDVQTATVQLCDEGEELEATFVPGAGMLCCSLRYRGEELLAQNDGVDAYARRGKTMGIPLLYPWANRLAAFDYSVAGKTVQVPHDPARIAVDDNGLPIHGVIGGRMGWESTDVSDHDVTSDLGAIRGSECKTGSDKKTLPDLTSGSGTRALAARLSWSQEQPELFEVFPFAHDLLYEARFTGGRLEITVTVHACGEDVVPVAFGFHPYLAPGAPRERWLVELPAMRHLALDHNQIPLRSEATDPGPASPAQRLDLGRREFDDGFDSVAEPGRFAVTASERRVELELSDGYPCAQVYAPLGGHFICFEPMTAPANALRSGDGLRLLNPGERYRAGFSLRIEDPHTRRAQA